MRAFGFPVHITKHLTKIAGAVAVATMALVALPSPAQAAFPPSPRDVHKRVVKDVRRVLSVPRAIHRAHVNTFRSFYHGRTYYRGHHHYHTTYRFPVYYGSRVVYRPYSYCNESLFIGRGAPVPRIVVNVRPDGYYYAPAPMPPPGYYERRNDDRYDRDHDRYDNHDRYDRDHDRDDHDRDDHDRYDDDDHDRYDDDDD